MAPYQFHQQVTFIYVKNLNVSSRFYGDILGLSLALDQGTCRIYSVTPTAFIGLCTGRAPNPGGVILTLVHPALEDWYAHLTQHDVPVTKPPTFNEAYNITHLFASDPDGYLVEIQVFHDPTWPPKP